MKTIQSKQGTLQGRDYWKALLIGAGTAVLTAIYQLYVTVGGFENISWSDVSAAAVSALILYLGKNFFEPSKVVTIEAEGKEAREIIKASDEGNPPPFGDPTHPRP